MVVCARSSGVTATGANMPSWTATSHFPKAGDDVRARALAWPFDEKALDYEGFFEVSTSASSALAAAGPMGAAGVGIRRLRRPVVRLRQ
jgi:hypothetical protein